MKAAILEKVNSPLIVDDIQLPDKLECGQVLVRVECSTICGAQIGEITGAKGEDKYLPHLLGHEGGGVVSHIGPGVTHVKQGDKVVMHWRKGIGIEANPPKYKWRDGIVGGGWITTFNEYAVVSENRLTKIDNDVPSEIASLMGCAVTTALGLINNEAKLKIGQSIAVIGCGGVGLNIIQGASMVGGNPIIAIDRLPSKLVMASSFGATHVIDVKGGWGRILQTIVGRKGVDIMVDCTGDLSMISGGYGLIASGGKMILVGQPVQGNPLILPSMLQHYKGKTLMDSQGGLTNPTIDIPKYLRLYKQGKLSLDSLITDSFPLDQINEAVELVKSGTSGRVLLNINQYE